MRGFCLALALAGLAYPFWRAWPHASEDFVYYDAANRLYWQGRDPYRLDAYQQELGNLLGRTNPFQTSTYSSPLPPALFLAAAPAAALPPRAAYAAWNALLFSCCTALWAMACVVLGLSPLSLDASLLAWALALFPGLFHSVFYHRTAVPAVCLLTAGALAWERGRPKAAALLWGGMVLTPQWFAPLLVFLAAGRERCWCVTALWLSALQIGPYLFGLHPWSEWRELLASLSHHAGAWVFSDEQNLVVGLYKAGLMTLDHSVAKLPFVPSSALLGAARNSSWIASWAGIVYLARAGRGTFTERLAAAYVVALAGSLYSHNGDMLWLLPGLLLGLRAARAIRPVPLRGLLAASAMLSLLVLPSYRRVEPYGRFIQGYWTAGCLLLALACWWSWTRPRTYSASDAAAGTP